MTAYFQPQLPLETIPAAWVPSDDNILMYFTSTNEELMTLAADWTGTGPQCTCQHKSGRCTRPIFGGYIVWEFRGGHLCATYAALMHFKHGVCNECAGN